MASVGLTVNERVAVLTFDDAPRRNAMTPELGDALHARVMELTGRPDVRAVVLTGAGGAFSAGGDLAMLERLRRSSFDDARRHMLAFYARYLSVLELPVPVIAAVEGPAIGAGLCVALACDLLVVGEDSKLALNFVQLGLHPGMGATWLLPRRVGAERAAELLLTGRRFDGREAQQLGLALEAVPQARVLPRALELAAQIAANAPLAVRALKRNLGVDRAALHAALEREALAQAESYGSADLGEGLAAAAERRAPRFEGR
ncbi:MAG: enoyl-CoA hydratase/isomerase family protein [Myxococcota bacterium]